MVVVPHTCGNHASDMVLQVRKTYNKAADHRLHMQMIDVKTCSRKDDFH